MKLQRSIKYRSFNLSTLKLHFQIPYHKRPGSKMSVEKNSYLWITERQEGKRKKRRGKKQTNKPISSG